MSDAASTDIAFNPSRTIIAGMENDVRGTRELLRAAHRLTGLPGGLDAEETTDVHRVIGVALEYAGQVEEQWEAAFSAGTQ